MDRSVWRFLNRDVEGLTPQTQMFRFLIYERRPTGYHQSWIDMYHKLGIIAIRVSILDQESGDWEVPNP